MKSASAQNVGIKGNNNELRLNESISSKEKQQIIK